MRGYFRFILVLFDFTCVHLHYKPSHEKQADKDRYKKGEKCDGIEPIYRKPAVLRGGEDLVEKL